VEVVLAIDYSRRKQVYKGVTRGQFEAISEAMRLIVEEDRERGVDVDARLSCPACGIDRPLVGSVDYEGIRLCNDCAIGYEVARIDRTAGTCAEFVAQRVARRS
jgi:hypothetical protein